MIDNAFTVLPGNSDLKSLQSKVEKATPTYLLDVCMPYESFGFQAFVNGETIAMGGKTYTNGFTLGGKNGDEYAIFNIDSQYALFSFLVGHRDGTDMNNATIKIYCDGVLKEELNVRSDDLPRKVSLDITGVNQLKVVAFGVNMYTSYGFANVTVK